MNNKILKTRPCLNVPHLANAVAYGSLRNILTTENTCTILMDDTFFWGGGGIPLVWQKKSSTHNNIVYYKTRNNVSRWNNSIVFDFDIISEMCEIAIFIIDSKKFNE